MGRYPGQAIPCSIPFSVPFCILIPVPFCLQHLSSHGNAVCRTQS